MMHKFPARRSAALLAALILGLTGASLAPKHALALESEGQELVVEPVVSGLDGPWGVGFLPDGTVLVTERRGRLLAIRDGQAQTVAGLPKIAVAGQGGLLDILVPRDFAQSREILFTYAARYDGGSGTALARGILSDDLSTLTKVETLFRMTPAGSATRHFGSRIVEAPDGRIFLTIGDRGQSDMAQDLSVHNGKVLRLNRDGSVPADNPFVQTPDARPEIWSYGHRNPQGAALDGAGQLWINEHGARGGDEVNRVRPGANYGWPVIAYGQNYNGTDIGIGTEAPGMEQPVTYWDPSIAPSGMTFYQGDAIPGWQGDAFVGALKFDYIARLAGDPLQEVEQIKLPETARVRAVLSGPDGALWFLSEDDGTLYRLRPAT